MGVTDPKLKRKRTFKIIVACLFGIAIGAAGFVAYQQYWTEDNPISDIVTRKATPNPKTTANPLDGTQVSVDTANRHPLAVIVENHTEARPHVGLDKASIVYEAIAEGGITRFMAIYGPKEATKIGPVRSVRTYFLDWAAEYDAFIAHVGGNIDALDRIQQEKPYDLDQFGVSDKAYWREPQAGKAIEHTMFTDLVKLYKVAEDKKWPKTGEFTSFKFLDPKKLEASSEAAQIISIDFSSPQYAVRYTHNSTNNNYARELAGVPHKDRATGNQLAPTNVIIQSVERQAVTTRINESGWAMTTTGEGKAIVLYGGQKIDATWKKTDLKSRTKFYDKDGKEISFLPGQFWYEIVPPDVFDKVKIETGTVTPTE